MINTSGPTDIGASGGSVGFSTQATTISLYYTSAALLLRLIVSVPASTCSRRERVRLLNCPLRTWRRSSPAHPAVERLCLCRCAGRLSSTPSFAELFRLPSPPTGRNRCRLLRGRFPGSSRSSRNSAKTSRLKRVQVSRPAVEPATAAPWAARCAGANPARRSAALARASRTATRRAEGRRAILLL